MAENNINYQQLLGLLQNGSGVDTGTGNMRRQWKIVGTGKNARIEYQNPYTPANDASQYVANLLKSQGLTPEIMSDAPEPDWASLAGTDAINPYVTKHAGDPIFQRALEMVSSGQYAPEDVAAELEKDAAASKTDPFAKYDPAAKGEGKLNFVSDLQGAVVQQLKAQSSMDQQRAKALAERGGIGWGPNSQKLVDALGGKLPTVNELVYGSEDPNAGRKDFVSKMDALGVKAEGGQSLRDAYIAKLRNDFAKTIPQGNMDPLLAGGDHVGGMIDKQVKTTGRFAGTRTVKVHDPNDPTVFDAQGLPTVANPYGNENQKNAAFMKYLVEQKKAALAKGVNVDDILNATDGQTWNQMPALVERKRNYFKEGLAQGLLRKAAVANIPTDKGQALNSRIARATSNTFGVVNND